MSESLREILAVRREKLDRLRKDPRGAYPNDFRPADTAAAVLEAHGERSAEDLEAKPTSVSVAGRVVGLRRFGKAAFLHLRDRTGKVQAYVRKGEVPDSELETFRLVDLGDHLGVEGRPFRTKTGELTIHAERVVFLGKALRPLPEKWHGLTDTETRFRQRYLDLTANDEVRDLFRRRARIIEAIRRFFADRDFVEVETPMMQTQAGGAAARPFLTHHNALDLELALRIAPELYLKRLLVGGFERVYELSRVFRNEGVSTQHNPEFTMLEFYQAYATYDDLMDLTEDLFLHVADSILGERRLRWGEHGVDLAKPWRRISLADAVREHAGASDADLASKDAIRAFAEAKGLAIDPAWGRGKILLELFEKYGESQLVQPTFVTRYPVEVSPLARRSDDDPDVTDRFELFIGGRELANAFTELNDPDDQRRRFEEQARAREAGDEEAQAVDEDFLLALDHGMPPAAGEGIGVDRLVMLFTDSASIRDVILFPLLRPQPGG